MKSSPGIQEYWRQHIRAFEGSGLPGARFCAQKRIKTHQLDYWRRWVHKHNYAAAASAANWICVKQSVKAVHVNCAPWSELKISGWAACSAQRNAEMQKLESMVVDTSHARTYGLYQWNMYSYTYNNPLRFVDRNGKWPTKIHNQIIDTAFKDALTPAQLQILKDVSAHQDSILSGGQGGSLAFQHAMRASGQSFGSAEKQYQDFVSQKLDQATRTQIDFWASGNPDLRKDALAQFAAALHAILDSTSPAHEGFQEWDWSSVDTHYSRPSIRLGAWA